MKRSGLSMAAMVATVVMVLNVHLDSDLIVLPRGLKFLYQPNTSFCTSILRSGLRIIQKSCYVKGLFEMPTPIKRT